jgi:hypothetical protein
MNRSFDHIMAPKRRLGQLMVLMGKISRENRLITSQLLEL